MMWLLLAVTIGSEVFATSMLRAAGSDDAVAMAGLGMVNLAETT
ncbi:hypothetical protein PAI11_21580 [Patulibacter medicamentivorans]|uniref:Uncharacterized protein n=1 Tax=Patulibacter medicamentivorans TaxID=1097667 RepID=H0E5Q9_9ACTN|nr:hypothetical protein [Patulibacter medicamentivorans]EHN11022.1 hypothetical protein PAI11_21580 [Patulibacter medicamentivorans]